MPIDIAFERHAGADTGNFCLRQLETILKGCNLEGALITSETDPKTHLTVSLNLTSKDERYKLRAAYVPAVDNKPDHITVTGEISDDTPTPVKDALELALLDVFDYIRN